MFSSYLIEWKPFAKASCTIKYSHSHSYIHIHWRKRFLQLVLLKVCKSFLFGQIKTLVEQFDLFEIFFAFLEDGTPKKYSLWETNLVFCM